MRLLATLFVLLFILMLGAGMGYSVAVFTGVISDPLALLPSSLESTTDAPPEVRGTGTGESPPADVSATQSAPIAEPTATTAAAATATTPAPDPTAVPTPILASRPSPASVAELSWITDGIDQSEQSAARELSYLKESNPRVARILLGRNWVADGVDRLEEAAIRRINNIADDLPALAIEIVELPWLVDDATQPESNVIEILWEVATRRDLALAERFIALPWLVDGITQTEAGVLSDLRFTARDDVSLAKRLLALPWLVDGITQTEAGVLSDLQYTAHDDVSLAKRLTYFPWLVDGITQTEAGVLSDLQYIAHDDVSLAKRLTSFPWLVDGVDTVELAIVERLYSIVRNDAELANAIAGKSWLADGLGKDAVRVVNGLYYIMDEDTALARTIADMSFLETLQPTDAAVLDALSWLAYTEILALREVLTHPTLKDGIRDEWAPVVALLDSVNEAAPAFLRPLLDPEQTTIERRALTLPHTGAVDLAIIRTEPGAARSMESLEHSAGSVESFMGVELPTNYVALLFGTAVLGYAGGTNYGAYFVMLPEYDADDDSDDADYAPQLMAHEVAHYYWSGNPNWLDEGLAELLAAISENERTGTVVAIDYTYCPDADNIALLERLDAAGVIYDYRCNYALGGQFFLEIYETLGDAAFRQGLRNLYLTSQVEDYTDEFDGSPVGIRQIQDAFQSDAATVAPIIDKWYHGN